MSPFESGENCPKELKQGEIGEICASGAVVSKTYYRMPGATCDSKFNDEKNSWDKKALSACGSAYTVVNLGSAVSTAGGHNSLSGTVACN